MQKFEEKLEAEQKKSEEEFKTVIEKMQNMEDGQGKLKEEIKAEITDYQVSIIKAKEEVKIEQTQLKADIEEKVELRTQEVGEELSAARKEIKAAQEDLSINRNSQDLPGNDKQEVSVVNRNDEIHLPEKQKLNKTCGQTMRARRKLRGTKFVRAGELEKLPQKSDVRPKRLGKCHRRKNARPEFSVDYLSKWRFHRLSI